MRKKTSPLQVEQRARWHTYGMLARTSSMLRILARNSFLSKGDKKFLDETATEVYEIYRMFSVKPKGGVNV